MDKYLELQVTLAIKLAYQLSTSMIWKLWADKWLDGSDRSYITTYAAAYAAYADGDTIRSQCAKLVRDYYPNAPVITKAGRS